MNGELGRRAGQLSIPHESTVALRSRICNAFGLAGRKAGRTTHGVSAQAFLVGVLLLAVVDAVPASPVGQRIAQDTDIAVFQHYHQDLLYTYMGDNRGYGPEHDLARDNIFAELSAQPNLTVVLEPFQYDDTTYYNIVATQTGTELPGEIVVVGAHFDSANNPGADDNATGTALVMEMARVLSRHRPVRTMKYVLFDREEQGRRGSIAFVADHSGENIVFAATADMVGYDSGVYGIDIYADEESAAVANGIAGAIETYGDTLTGFLDIGPFYATDHRSFENAGIPAFAVIEYCYSCNPYYHTAEDAVDNPYDPDYISYSMLADLARSFAGFLADEAGFHLYGDFNDDAEVDFADYSAFDGCFTGASGGPVVPMCLAGDFDLDDDIDCTDWLSFTETWTGEGDPPGLSQCEQPIPTVSQWGLCVMTLLLFTAGTLVVAQRRRAEVRSQ